MPSKRFSWRKLWVDESPDFAALPYEARAAAAYLLKFAATDGYLGPIRGDAVDVALALLRVERPKARPMYRRQLAALFEHGTLIERDGGVYFTNFGDYQARRTTDPSSTASRSQRASNGQATGKEVASRTANAAKSLGPPGIAGALHAPIQEEEEEEEEERELNAHARDPSQADPTLAPLTDLDDPRRPDALARRVHVLASPRYEARRNMLYSHGAGGQGAIEIAEHVDRMPDVDGVEAFDRVVGTALDHYFATDDQYVVRSDYSINVLAKQFNRWLDPPKAKAKPRSRDEVEEARVKRKVEGDRKASEEVSRRLGSHALDAAKPPADLETMLADIGRRVAPEKQN